MRKPSMSSLDEKMMDPAENGNEKMMTPRRKKDQTGTAVTQTQENKTNDVKTEKETSSARQQRGEAVPLQFRLSDQQRAKYHN